MSLLSLDPGSPAKAAVSGVVIVACGFVLDRFCDAVAFSRGPRTFPVRDQASIADGVCHSALTPLLWLAAAGLLALLAGLALARWGGDRPANRRLAGGLLLASRLAAVVLVAATLVTLIAYNWLDLDRW